eukprot:5162128-Amphidinium_carterae.1
MRSRRSLVPDARDRHCRNGHSSETLLFCVTPFHVTALSGRTSFSERACPVIHKGHPPMQGGIKMESTSLLVPTWVLDQLVRNRLRPQKLDRMLA